MKKPFLFSLSFLALSLVLIFNSCTEDKDEEPAETEFIADNNTFTSFMSWPLEATNQGTDPALGAAHAGNDASVIRQIYFKNGQNPVNGNYPVGSVVVKHSSNPDKSVNEFTAMVKRGNNFNPDFGNWEFFMLTPTGAIASDANGTPMRGASLMDGMCAGCHAGASNKDFIFSK
jgi:hypothetical protein